MDSTPRLVPSEVASNLDLPPDTPRRDCAVARGAFTRTQLTADFHSGVDAGLLPVNRVGSAADFECPSGLVLPYRKALAPGNSSVMTARVLVITRGLLAFPIQFDQRELNCVDEPRFPCFCVSAVDYQKQIGVRTGAPQIGVSRVFLTLTEHLLTSFHTILRVRFGGHLPSSQSF